MKKRKKTITFTWTPSMLETFEGVVVCDAESIAELVERGRYQDAMETCTHVSVLCEILMQAKAASGSRF